MYKEHLEDAFALEIFKMLEDITLTRLTYPRVMKKIRDQKKNESSGVICKLSDVESVFDFLFFTSMKRYKKAIKETLISKNENEKDIIFDRILIWFELNQLYQKAIHKQKHVFFTSPSLWPLAHKFSKQLTIATLQNLRPNISLLTHTGFAALWVFLLMKWSEETDEECFMVSVDQCLERCLPYLQ